jgi:ferredoxin
MRSSSTRSSAGTAHPKVNDANWLSFTDTAANIEEGYRSATRALERFDSYWGNEGCVFPRRRVQLEVDREKCTGCTLCATLAPAIMAMDSKHKAYARTRIVDWSPAEGGFVHECPTYAISARNIDRRAANLSEEGQHDPSPSGAGTA